MHAGSIGSRSLFGRAAELRTLRARIAAAVAGEGSCLLIADPPGIGKSRLLEEAVALAREVGASVHRARCWEEGGAPPFWPWIQIARSIGGEPIPLPAGKGTAGAAESAEERFLAYAAMAEGLVQRARDAPRLLIIDDLHAADPLSLGMLVFLATAVRDARIAIICAYRDAEVAADVALAARFADLEREAEVIHLGGLTAGDVLPWVTAKLGEVQSGFAPALIERTGGNPLFIDAILRSIEANRGGSDLPDPRSVALPFEVGSAVRGWIARLTAETRSVLATAAVIGFEFEMRILRVLVGDGERVVRGMSEGTASGVLAPGPTGAQTRRFSHALLHDALYESFPDAERRSLDHRIAALHRAEAADRNDESTARIANHLLRSADAETARWAFDSALQAAGSAERRFADADAARFLQHALDIARQFKLIDDNQAAELLLRLGQHRFNGR
jgi:predicted ATPase